MIKNKTSKKLLKIQKNMSLNQQDKSCSNYTAFILMIALVSVTGPISLVNAHLSSANFKS